MMDWSNYEEEEHVQETHSHWLRLFWHIACCACLGVILAMAVREARAEPIYKGTNEGVTLTLYSEPCQLKEHVTNLPNRITWEEKGQTFEGCFGANQGGFLVAYFVGDKTVAIIPIDIFVKVTGA